MRNANAPLFNAGTLTNTGGTLSGSKVALTGTNVVTFPHAGLLTGNDLWGMVCFEPTWDNTSEPTTPHVFFAGVTATAPQINVSYATASNAWQIYRGDATNSDLQVESTGDTVTVGERKLVYAYSAAASCGIGSQGRDFTVNSTTPANAINLSSYPNMYIGNNVNSNRCIEGSVLWAAFGKGIPTAAFITTMWAIAQVRDPRPGDLIGANTTMLATMDSTTYRYRAT